MGAGRYERCLGYAGAGRGEGRSNRAMEEEARDVTWGSDVRMGRIGASNLQQSHEVTDKLESSFHCATLFV